MTTTSLAPVNSLLAGLTPEIQRAWFPKLKKVDLALGTTVGRPGQPKEYAYFPLDCTLAVLNVMDNGSTVSTAMVGHEGMFSIDIFLGHGQATNYAVTQASGTAYRLPAAELVRSFTVCPSLRCLLLSYTLTLIQQMGQTSSCNCRHGIDQRLCRWILLSLDRQHTNTLTITQELISQLLGVRREGISEAGGRLQRAGAIDHRRGKIQVLDRTLLEEWVCGCYTRPVEPEYRSKLVAKDAISPVMNPVYSRRHIMKEASRHETRPFYPDGNGTPA